MSLESDITESVCEAIIEDRLKRDSWFKQDFFKQTFYYYAIRENETRYNSCEFIDKVFDIAEVTQEVITEMKQLTEETDPHKIQSLTRNDLLTKIEEWQNKLEG
jgi:uncharacterized membrane-anchored protein YjiN (DUF445 family)